ncbi:hypothetical protein C8R46DRAFT_1043665 [Mycena filopes]|nr:hypothetical protein C8R46DRAFT_1043665 [Mycena filopes]
MSLTLKAYQNPARGVSIHILKSLGGAARRLQDAPSLCGRVNWITVLSELKWAYQNPARGASIHILKSLGGAARRLQDAPSLCGRVNWITVLSELNVPKPRSRGVDSYTQESRRRCAPPPGRPKLMREGELDHGAFRVENHNEFDVESVPKPRSRGVDSYTQESRRRCAPPPGRPELMREGELDHGAFRVEVGLTLKAYPNPPRGASIHILEGVLGTASEVPAEELKPANAPNGTARDVDTLIVFEVGAAARRSRRAHSERRGKRVDECEEESVDPESRVRPRRKGGTPGVPSCVDFAPGCLYLPRAGQEKKSEALPNLDSTPLASQKGRRFAISFTQVSAVREKIGKKNLTYGAIVEHVEDAIETRRRVLRCAIQHFNLTPNVQLDNHGELTGPTSLSGLRQQVTIITSQCSGSRGTRGEAQQPEVRKCTFRVCAGFDGGLGTAPRRKLIVFTRLTCTADNSRSRIFGARQGSEPPKHTFYTYLCRYAGWAEYARTSSSNMKIKILSQLLYLPSRYSNPEFRQSSTTSVLGVLANDSLSLWGLQIHPFSRFWMRNWKSPGSRFDVLFAISGPPPSTTTSPPRKFDAAINSTPDFKHIHSKLPLEGRVSYGLVLLILTPSLVHSFQSQAFQRDQPSQIQVSVDLIWAGQGVRVSIGPKNDLIRTARYVSWSSIEPKHIFDAGPQGIKSECENDAPLQPKSLPLFPSPFSVRVDLSWVVQLRPRPFNLTLLILKALLEGFKLDSAGAGIDEFNISRVILTLVNANCAAL